MTEKHSLFLSQFQMQFQRGRELMEAQRFNIQRIIAAGGNISGIEIFQRFSDMEVEKIQKFVLKDNFNTSKYLFRAVNAVFVVREEDDSV